MNSPPPLFRHLPARGPELPLLVSIPHTGTYVPPQIAARFASPTMAQGEMTDWHLHELYAFLPDLGVDVIHATHHRFVVDLNRPPDSSPLYPGRFETGLVPTATFQGANVWRVSPDAKEVQERRERYHRPFHAALEQQLMGKVARFGRCTLIDAHSVESRANRLHGALQHEIYLGDRDGKTCDPRLMELVAGEFGKRGLQVSINNPYKGGYITAHYPGMAGVQTLQIEMVQKLYMEEGAPRTALQHPRFAAFSGTLRGVFEAIAATRR